MRPTDAIAQERHMALFKRHSDAAREAGLVRVRIEDEHLDPAFITVRGKRVLNFGLCSYLGLSMDKRLVEGATKALENFGAVYSSSATYSAVGLYSQLEERLRSIFGATVVIAPTTTLGHLSALPTLVGPRDVVLVDNNAHASVHLATRVVASEGVPILPVRHNDLDDLESQIDQLSGLHRRVWFLADGVYSMSGGVAPIRKLGQLLDKYPELHLYLDDAHGFGWTGRHGSGWVLKEMDWHPRLVVAVGFAKSWSSGGAALAFGDERMASDVATVGGTLTFSGPLHPAQLGASIAAADIHLSPEYEELRESFSRQIEFVTRSLVAARIEVLSLEQTPIWVVPVGNSVRALELAQRLLERGFFTNFAAFPAVPMHQSGIRFMNTLCHTDEDILSLVEALSELVPEIVGETEIEIDLTAMEASEPLRKPESA